MKKEIFTKTITELSTTDQDVNVSMFEISWINKNGDELIATMNKSEFNLVCEFYRRQQDLLVTDQKGKSYGYTNDRPGFMAFKTCITAIFDKTMNMYPTGKRRSDCVDALYIAYEAEDFTRFETMPRSPVVKKLEIR